MKLDDLGLGQTGAREGTLTAEDIYNLIVEAVENDYSFMLAIARSTGGGVADTICLPSAGTSMDKWAEIVADNARALADTEGE